MFHQEEAFNAQRNGKILNGHHIVIDLTDKIPTTQILTLQPQPLRSTLRPTQSSASTVGRENKAKVQASLASYFQQKSGPKKENKEPGTSTGGVPRAPTMTSILDEAASATLAGKKNPMTKTYYYVTHATGYKLCRSSLQPTLDSFNYVISRTEACKNGCCSYD